MIRAAQAFFELGTQQDRLRGIQQSLEDQQTRNTRDSRAETRAIDDKTDKIKALTTARKLEHEAALAKIQPLRDETEDVQTLKRARDREFDLQERGQERLIRNFKNSTEPIIDALKAPFCSSYSREHKDAILCAIWA